MLDNHTGDENDPVITYSNIMYYEQSNEDRFNFDEKYTCQDIGNGGVIIDENTIYEIDPDCFECLQKKSMNRNL